MSTCVRHPEKSARRKCYRCKRVICVDCYFQRDHHIFCGRGCWLRFTAATWRTRVSGAMQRRLPLPFFVAALLLIAVPSALLLLAVTRELDAPFFHALLRRATFRTPLGETAVAEPISLPARPAPARLVESFTRGGEELPALVLSFDAGSTDRGAREILDILRQRQIRTTIFLTGEFIHSFPAVARQIVADGHEVGNHTWSHPHLTTFARDRRQATLPGMTREKFQAELRRTAIAFKAATGADMTHFWRAPFGEENGEIRGWAAELGYLHVGWTRGRKYNLDSLDWVVDRQSPIYFTPEQLTHRLLNFDVANDTTLNGGIILMHLGTDRSEDERLSRALPMMIDQFAQKGFRFVKVSELKEGTHAG